MIWNVWEFLRISDIRFFQTIRSSESEDIRLLVIFSNFQTISSFFLISVFFLKSDFFRLLKNLQGCWCCAIENSCSHHSQGQRRTTYHCQEFSCHCHCWWPLPKSQLRSIDIHHRVVGGHACCRKGWAVARQRPPINVSGRGHWKRLGHRGL